MRTWGQPAKGRKPRWQQQVEKILKDKFQEDELEKMLTIANELVGLSLQVDVPRGAAGKVVAYMLGSASEDLRPLSAVYTGFKLGVAYERHQNAKGT